MVRGLPGLDLLAAREHQPPGGATLGGQRRERHAELLEIAALRVVVVDDRELPLGAQPVLVGRSGFRPL